MAQIKSRGIIIKQSDYGEGHRLLSVFTEDYGIVKAVSYGVKRARSKTSASTQFLCWGDFEFYKGFNKDILTVNSVDTIEGFYPLSEDIKKLALCVYMSDITYAVLGANNPDDRLLRLFLNSLYALAYKDEDTGKVKAVYELKLMCAGGYMPALRECVSCGKGDVHAFDMEKGGMVCRECAGRETVKMDNALFRAIDYIVSCGDKRMLSFNAAPELIKRLGDLSERYISLQMDMNFQSLDYYKAMS